MNQQKNNTARYIALGAAAGPVLFTISWIILGIMQPVIKNMYGVMGGISGAISNPISGLGVGPQATLFNLSFIICGLLTAVGIWGCFESFKPAQSNNKNWISIVLLALSPLGLTMAGIYTLAVSISFHVLAAALVFITPVISFLVVGIFFRSIPDWRRFGNWLLVASPITLLLMVGYSFTFNQTTVAAGHGIAGLTERIMLIEIQLWYVAMGWKAFRISGISNPSKSF